jgi:NADH dehydrogenase FAD-containing subunit
VLPGAVLVIGGGSVGCEVAEHLANPGDNHTIGEYAVTVVEQREAIGLDLSGEARAVLMPRLREKGVRCLTAATVKELTTDGAVIVQQGEEITLRGFSLIVLATGSSPDQGLVAPLRAVGFEPLVIGDAVKVRSALEAIREGAEAGRRV